MNNWLSLTGIVCFQGEGDEENLSKEEAVGMLDKDMKHEEDYVTDSGTATTTEIDKLLQELADDPEEKENSTESIISATNQSTVNLVVDEQEPDEHHVGHEETEDQFQKQVDQKMKEEEDHVGYGGSHDTSNDDDSNEVNGSTSKLKNLQVAIVCLTFPIAYVIYPIVWNWENANAFAFRNSNRPTDSRNSDY